MSPRQRTVSACGRASSRTARRASRLPWISDRMAYRTARGSGRGPQLFADAVQNAVDEAARLFGPELLGDLDGLVDGHLGWHLAGQKLVHRHAEEVTVHHRHAIQLPVLRVLADELIGFVLVLLSAAHEGVGEDARVVVH